MKSVLFSIAFAIMITNLSFSQENYVGIRAGINSATITGNKIVADRTIKASMGVVYSKMISSNWAIQPEVAYHGGGFKSISDFPFLSIRNQVTWHYLTLPILFKYFLNENLSINVGPQLGLMIGNNKISDQDTSEGFKSTDFGLNLGAEAFVSNRIGFSGRYVAGLSDIDKNNSTSNIDIGDIKSNAIQLSLLVKLN
jgi:hypothetical protein